MRNATTRPALALFDVPAPRHEPELVDREELIARLFHLVPPATRTRVMRVDRLVRCLDALTGGRQLKARELAAQLSLTTHQVCNELDVLRRAGLVVGEHAGYRITFRLAPPQRRTRG